MTQRRDNETPLFAAITLAVDIANNIGDSFVRESIRSQHSVQSPKTFAEAHIFRLDQFGLFSGRHSPHPELSFYSHLPASWLGHEQANTCSFAWHKARAGDRANQLTIIVEPFHSVGMEIAVHAADQARLKTALLHMFDCR